MTFMTRGENLCGGHVDSPPPAPAFSETLHGLFPLGAIHFLTLGRNKMGNCLAMARDRNGLAALDRP